MSDILRHYFQKEKPQFHQFLAHCIVRRALRSVPEIRLSHPPVIGIIAGRNPPMDEIQDALTLLRLPDLKVLRNRFQDPVAVFLDCEPTSTKRPRKLEKIEEEFLIALKGKKAIFAVVEEEGDLPDLFRKIADRIIYLEGPTPRHLQAAFAYCVRVQISLEDAERLTRHSLFDLTMAASRGKSWRKVLEAISEDKSKADENPANVELSLETLAGLGEAGEWGRELAVDLKEWRTGKLPWSDVNRGVLVAGPPGTGKTTYAKALAKSCGVELVASSLAQWQAAGHLGDLLKAMRRTFAEARKKAPCVLFLDEFDSVGDRRTVRGDNALYVVEKINGLLECLDGVEDREGIVVVAACNHPEIVDPAFLRPGRLERTICIPLPDRQAREQILRWHLKGALEHKDLSNIADRLEGHSGADIEKFVRDARRSARRERRDLEHDDLVSRLPNRIAFSQADLRRIAVHEAGHAIVHASVGDGEIVRLRIEPELAMQGTKVEVGCLEIRKSALKGRTRRDYEAQLMVHLAGLAAEELVFGEIADGGGGSSGSDLAFATQIATEMEASLGFGDSLVQLIPNGSKQVREVLLTDRVLRQRVEATLDKAYEDARGILEENKPAHEALFDALMQRHELKGREVLEIISGAGEENRRVG
ncbi:ATP-dependent Zn protease [Roseibium hamelinense]|uniref:ATP-dependent Zn protease n=1 Tax=Roseibium hamelinense TaxID=150831 RepID=A0A562SVK1_9HYPH|nr:AAA family ATPase [Roseibium hamelinense]MTI42510.1 AAA family ATPase [Roseibium hamelinense]TWI84846.1 ATP-dependent Zn protease [Roseibium hamelinense]